MANPSRRAPARVLLALGVTLLVGLVLPPLVSAQTTSAAPSDPVLVALQQVFGDVALTTTTGGVPHSGREPAEWANFAATARGDRGVLYRTDQQTCPPSNASRTLNTHCDWSAWIQPNMRLCSRPWSMSCSQRNGQRNSPQRSCAADNWRR